MIKNYNRLKNTLFGPFSGTLRVQNSIHFTDIFMECSRLQDGYTFINALHLQLLENHKDAYLPNINNSL